MPVGQVARAELVVLLAISAAAVAGWLSGVVVRRAARGRSTSLIMTLNRAGQRPWTVVLNVAGVVIAAPATGLTDAALHVVRHVLLTR
jgi:hypothetical protein